MKKIITTSVIALGTLFIIGCGGGGTVDSGDTLVGEWLSKCVGPDEDGRYGQYFIKFNSDNTMNLKINKYTDSACEEDEEEQADVNGTYLEGVRTMGASGESATELKMHLVEDFYTMYLFKDNGDLAVATEDETHDGSSEANRSNHFNPDFEFKRQ